MMRITTLIAASAAALALQRVSATADDRTEVGRETQPPPQPKPTAPTNLAGETNRQFAARMAAEQEGRA